jgi:hypothetical protein
MLVPMFNAHRVNVVRDFEEQEVKTFRATILWLKASVSLFFCPNNFINHYCICLALTLMGSYFG